MARTAAAVISCMLLVVAATHAAKVTIAPTGDVPSGKPRVTLVTPPSVDIAAGRRLAAAQDLNGVLTAMVPVDGPTGVSIAQAHNQLRLSVPAGNMQGMMWSDELAASAAAWAGKCVFEHSPSGTNFRGSNVGENLFLTTSPNPSPEDAFAAWASEAADYDFASNQCSAVCGHYTQLVWASTTMVGCAAAECATTTSLSGNEWTDATVMVCQYAPAGNVNGARPFIAGDSCSKCPSSHGYCVSDFCSALKEDGLPDVTTAKVFGDSCDDDHLTTKHGTRPGGGRTCTITATVQEQVPMASVNTIAAWFKLSQLPAPLTLPTQLFGLEGTDELSVGVFSTQTESRVALVQGTSVLAFAGPDLAAGEWHHIAVVVSESGNGGHLVYIDGQIVARMSDADATFVFGSDYDFFVGAPGVELDDMTMFHRALTVAEIGWIMDEGVHQTPGEQPANPDTCHDGMFKYDPEDGTKPQLAVTGCKRFGFSCSAETPSVKVDGTVYRLVGDFDSFAGVTSACPAAALD